MTRAPEVSPQPYLPRLVLDWQLTVPDVSWREMEGSMVFVDVSGFTMMSERLARRGRVGAEEVTEVIGSTFGRLLAEAYAFGGTLLKFGGDALLLFFEGVGHPVRAAAAAHRMRARLREMGTFTTTAGKVGLRMSVGAHTGLFQFFLVGESHRELVVGGPAMSELVAMEQAASAGQILLSPAMAAALPRGNRGREVGPGVLLARPVEADRFEVDVPASDVDLTPFIPKALREKVVGGRVDPEHRPVTVAFLHFSGLDDLVRSSGPVAAADALEGLVRAVQRTVDEWGVAFLASDVASDGGKIILTAGAPEVTGSDEELMLLTVREVVSAERELAVRVGVNRGYVFAGEIGPSYRRTYTVMGDAVNLAARLMAKAEPGQVLTTGEVLAGSRTLFRATPLEPFHVKGKKHPVEALAVGEPEGSRSAMTEAGLPLVGRETELGVLIDAWEAAGEGSGMLVELVGEAGMGKSRLLEELLVRVGEARVLTAECRLYQSTTPYFPFQALLARALGLEGLEDEAAAARLEEIVEEHAPHLVRWLALIGVPLGLEIAESEEVGMLDDRFRRTRLEEAVWELVSAVLTDPVVFVVEDTHWMDEASRDLLAKAAGLVADRPWLIVASRRPGSHGFTPPDDSEAVTSLTLEPLGIEQAEALIRTATEDSPLMPQQIRALSERAEGNPLFLIELLHALRQGEQVEGLPHSVEGLIGARIDRLPPTDRTMLRHISVLGAGFQADHAAVVLDTGTETGPALERLAEFVATPRDGWVQFRHALIRDVAYQGLPYRTRQQLHARVADNILQSAGDQPEDQAELLSLHYYHAKQWEQAWTYSRIAGDNAKNIYANLEAAEYYQRAIRAATRIPDANKGDRAIVLTQLGDVSVTAGLFEHGFKAYRDAGKLLEDQVARSELHLKRARTRLRLGSFSNALREITHGYRLVEDTESTEATRARARLLAYRGGIEMQRGHPKAALANAMAALGLAESIEDRETLARAYFIMDGAYEMLGQAEKAVYSAKALEIYEEAGDLSSVAVVENNMGFGFYIEGKWDEALQAFQRARARDEQAGDEAQAAGTAANIGEVLLKQGRIEEAERILTESVRVLKAYRLAEQATNAEIQLARVQLVKGHTAQAHHDFERLYQQAVEAGEDGMILEAGLGLAESHLRSGMAEAAMTVLDDAEQRAGDMAVFYRPSLARTRAEALAIMGAVEEATREVAKGLASARQLGRPYEEALLLLTRAQLVELNGDDGSNDRQTARETLSRLGSVLAGSEFINP